MQTASRTTQQRTQQTTRSIFKVPAFLLLALFAGLSVGCNTMEGAGRDIERAGEEIEDAAR